MHAGPEEIGRPARSARALRRERRRRVLEAVGVGRIGIDGGGSRPGHSRCGRKSRTRPLVKRAKELGLQGRHRLLGHSGGFERCPRFLELGEPHELAVREGQDMTNPRRDARPAAPARSTHVNKWPLLGRRHQ